MIVIVEERAAVADGYEAWLAREGVASASFGTADFAEWVTSAPSDERSAVEAVLIGGIADRHEASRQARGRLGAAVIAISEEKSLDETLSLFAAGVDDVVRKPVHVREILARIRAINRRGRGERDGALIGDLRVFADGRDPEVAGAVLVLPRRERRILEYLVANKGCRVSKSQIFNSVYGLFSEDIDENVIESHISKLRKRLRGRLGYDPIESQRFLGYRLVDGDRLAQHGDKHGAGLPGSRGDALPLA